AVQNFLHDFAADIFKINVNAVGSRGGQFFLPVGVLVVDGSVETEFLGDPGAFFIGAGDADDAAAVNLANLPGDPAGGSGSGGNDQRFAFLCRGDFHSEKCSEPVGAEHAEKNGV